jgi:hypothetical protein
MCGFGQTKHLMAIKMGLIYSSYKINLADDVIGYSLTFRNNTINVAQKGNKDDNPLSTKNQVTLN